MTKIFFLLSVLCRTFRRKSVVVSWWGFFVLRSRLFVCYIIIFIIGSIHLFILLAHFMPQFCLSWRIFFIRSSLLQVQQKFENCLSCFFTCCSLFSFINVMSSWTSEAVTFILNPLTLPVQINSTAMNGRSSTPLSNEDKINMSTLHVDGIPTETLNKVRVTWGHSVVVVVFLHVANLKLWWWMIFFIELRHFWSNFEHFKGVELIEITDSATIIRFGKDVSKILIWEFWSCAISMSREVCYF